MPMFAAFAGSPQISNNATVSKYPQIFDSQVIVKISKIKKHNNSSNAQWHTTQTKSNSGKVVELFSRQTAAGVMNEETV